MKKKLNAAKVDLLGVTKIGTKTDTFEALNELGWAIQKLVYHQSLLCELNYDSLRLVIYDDSMEDLTKSFENLAKLIQVKQAGGRKSNPLFSIAYRIVKDHYKKSSKIMIAKKLVKAVNQFLYNKAENPDKHGNEPFSERLAGDCIRLFKKCRKYENFDDI